MPKPLCINYAYQKIHIRTKPDYKEKQKKWMAAHKERVRARKAVSSPISSAKSSS